MPCLHPIPRISLLLSALVVLASCAAPGPTPTEAPEDPDYGFTKAKAIEVCSPNGQREYLLSLACPSGEAPRFRRIGSLGPRVDPPPESTGRSLEQQVAEALRRTTAPLKPGEPDYHIVDGYAARCGDKEVTLVLDMYHCGQPSPTRAPKGFKKRQQ